MSLSQLRTELKSLRGVVKPISKMTKTEVVRELERVGSAKASHTAVRAAMVDEEIPVAIAKKTKVDKVKIEKVVSDVVKTKSGKAKPMTLAELREKVADCPGGGKKKRGE